MVTITCNGNVRLFAVYDNLATTTAKYGQSTMLTTQDSNVVTHRSTGRTNPTDQSHERPPTYYPQFLPSSEKPCNDLTG